MPSPTGHAARLALAVLLCALAMTPVAGAAAGPPSRTGAASWTAQPAVSGSGTGGRPYFYLEGPPGTVLRDRISVTNPGRSPVTVRLSGADAYDAKGGDSGVRADGTGGSGSTGTGRWLRTAATEVTVPARTRADVPFTVTVPAGATPGDHPAAIVVRGGDRSVGVRVRLRVGGPTLAALTVEDVTVSGRAIHYTLVNRGNAVLAPRIAVRADGVFGTLLRREARTLPVEVRPGQRVRLTEPWRDVPALDSATVRLRVTAAGGAHGEATARAVFVPWAPLTAGALLVLAAAGAGTYAYRHRRSRDRRPDDEERPGRSPGDQQHSGSRHLAKAGAES
ncbi:hypothetical protein OG978_16460 [Streptomyces sp. NBC_01591]|uniref:hypothetical protein n=1 Tax=Streptomyces sp. NBC_01591 TaxID=2975888 RepID=UPI002DDAF04B|nr:hypothetical protein [Streptomyces sp. NBC_01591]WSD68852.1 hypothetical protein OG978_16460 [Streptomyces sp. NBC_01591]